MRTLMARWWTSSLSRPAMTGGRRAIYKKARLAAANCNAKTQSQRWKILQCHHGLVVGAPLSRMMRDGAVVGAKLKRRVGGGHQASRHWFLTRRHQTSLQTRMNRSSSPHPP